MCLSSQHALFRVSEINGALLCLIGLRHNQIEHDNCVSVTFSVTRAGPRGKDGERVHLHVQMEEPLTSSSTEASSDEIIFR